MKQAIALNKALAQQLRKKGARIDAFYICPHRYPSPCTCRKPAIGLLKQAKRKFGIDFKKSFIAGDSTRDVMTGKNAGVKTILVMTGIQGGGDDKKFFKVKADFVARDLLAAARIIEKEGK